MPTPVSRTEITTSSPAAAPLSEILTYPELVYLKLRNVDVMEMRQYARWQETKEDLRVADKVDQDPSQPNRVQADVPSTWSVLQVQKTLHFE